MASLEPGASFVAEAKLLSLLRAHAFYWGRTLGRRFRVRRLLRRDGTVAEALVERKS